MSLHSTFTFTRICQTQTCSSKRAKIRSRSTNIYTLSACANITSLFGRSTFFRKVFFQTLTSSAWLCLTTSISSSYPRTVIFLTRFNSAIRAIAISNSVYSSARTPPKLIGTSGDGATSTRTSDEVKFSWVSSTDSGKFVGTFRFFVSYSSYISCNLYFTQTLCVDSPPTARSKFQSPSSSMPS